MSKIVLIIAVHPDDETLGCGGTIQKHKDKGDRVYWLILTQANQRVTNIPKIVEQQARYVNQVSLEYNFDGWAQFQFLTTELDKYPFGEIVNQISKHIKRIKPQIIYFNHFADVHSDHKVAFDAIWASTKNFKFPYIDKILLFETLSETEFSPAVLKNAFSPNVFNDITPFMEKKLEIMKLFTTEQQDEHYPRALSSIRALARYRGSRIGVKYAEAFMLILERT